MTVSPTNLRNSFNKTLNYGDRVRIKYFSISGGSADYDDVITYSQSGSDLWTSGLVQPFDTSKGSYDAVLMEQGRLTENSIKMYLKGSETTSGLFQIGVGSPVRREYKVIENGVINWDSQGTVIYKKVYLDYLQTGSLF